MSDDLKHIKHGWGSRALATGKIASSVARIAGRRLIGRDDDDTNRAIGAKLAHELDGMTGLAMKVGQILSYFDGALPAGMDEALRELQQGARPVAFDAHWEMVCHQYAPYRTPRFRFTRDYITAGASFTGPSNPNLRRLAIPPRWIWLTRLQWGLHAVLARLQAEGPFAELLRAQLGQLMKSSG